MKFNLFWNIILTIGLSPSAFCRDNRHLNCYFSLVDNMPLLLFHFYLVAVKSKSVVFYHQLRFTILKKCGKSGRIFKILTSLNRVHSWPLSCRAARRRRTWDFWRGVWVQIGRIHSQLFGRRGRWVSLYLNFKFKF